MEVIVPKSELKIDPRHPESTDPDYAKDKRKADELYRNMKFDSEAQRADYLRAVKSNPGNMAGLPILYPPLQIRSYVTGLNLGRERTEQERFEDWQLEHCVKECELHCSYCHKITPHGYDTRTHKNGSIHTWCKKCGNDYKTNND